MIWGCFAKESGLTFESFPLPSEGVNIIEYQPDFDKDLSEKRSLKFLYAGRIVWSKGVKEFYEAALHFKNKGMKVEFSMLGFIVPEHPDAVSFNLVQQWHKDGVVEYLGETEDIRPYLKGTDCLVLPSYFGKAFPGCCWKVPAWLCPSLQQIS